jgi:hypothetical protein
MNAALLVTPDTHLPYYTTSVLNKKVTPLWHHVKTEKSELFIFQMQTRLVPPRNILKTVPTRF